MSTWKRWSAKHEALKKRIHNTRIPLGPWGKLGMGLVYFSVPIILGCGLMLRIMDVSDANFEERMASTDPAQVSAQAKAIKFNKTAEIVPAALAQADALRAQLQAELAALDTPDSTER